MQNLDLLIPQPLAKGDWWTWATVTQASPVRVRLDGDSAAIPETVDSLVRNLVVGDRVWVQVSNRRIVIQGKANGQANELQSQVTTNTTNIASNTSAITSLQSADTGFNSRITTLESKVTDSGWIAPTMTNSWVNYGGNYTTLAYRKINGVVHLRGLIKDGTINAAICTLPAGYRPSGQTVFMQTGSQINETTGAASAGTAHTHSVPINNGPYRVDVQSTGVVSVASTTAANTWVSMSGICFPADL